MTSGTLGDMGVARRVAEGLPPLREADLDARLRVGGFEKPLPGALAPSVMLARTMMDLAISADATFLDSAPYVETRFGSVPTGVVEWIRTVNSLAGHPENRAGADGRLLQAALLVEARTRKIAAAWTDKLDAIHDELVKAETMARRYLAGFLAHNQKTLAQQRRRYDSAQVGPTEANLALRQLMAYVGQLSNARKAAQLEQRIWDDRLVTAVTMAAQVAAMGAAYATPVGPALQLSEAHWDVITWASGLQDQTARKRAEAAVAFLQVLREAGRRHPIALVLRYRDDPPTVSQLVNLLSGAYDDVDQAIGDVWDGGVGIGVLAERRQADWRPSGVAKELANAPNT